MPKQQQTRDVRNFFKVSPLKSPDSTELTREQKLAQRIEDRRTSFGMKRPKPQKQPIPTRCFNGFLKSGRPLKEGGAGSS